MKFTQEQIEILEKIGQLKAAELSFDFHSSQVGLTTHGVVDCPIIYIKRDEPEYSEVMKIFKKFVDRKLEEMKIKNPNLLKAKQGGKE